MKYCKVSITVLILLNVSFQQAVMAQAVPGHVIPGEELQNQLIVQSAQRMEHIQEIQKLLRQNLVQQEVGKLVDLERVELALAALDDETLNQLAVQSREVNDQIEAGMATWGWVVIVAIVAFVTMVIVVAAVVDFD